MPDQKALQDKIESGTQAIITAFASFSEAMAGMGGAFIGLGKVLTLVMNEVGERDRQSLAINKLAEEVPLYPVVLNCRCRLMSLSEKTIENPSNRLEGPVLIASRGRYGRCLSR